MLRSGLKLYTVFVKKGIVKGTIAPYYLCMSISEIKQNVDAAVGHLEDSRGSEWTSKTVAETYGLDNAAELVDQLKGIVGRWACIDPGTAMPISVAAERAQAALGNSLVGMGNTERVSTIEDSLIRIGEANGEQNAAYTAMMKKRDMMYTLVGALGTHFEEYQAMMDTYTLRAEEQAHLRDHTIGELKAAVTGL